MTPATAHMHRLWKAASRAGARLFRNNVGQAWTGEIVYRDQGTITLKDPRPFHGGLAEGSSDLIGWTPVEITPDMVGQQVAVFTAVEVKSGKGRATKQQRRFIEAVQAAGGRAAVARDEDEARGVVAPR